MGNYDLVDRTEYDISGSTMTTTSTAASQSPELHEFMHLVDVASKRLLVRVASTNLCLLGLIGSHGNPVALHALSFCVGTSLERDAKKNISCKINTIFGRIV